MKVLILAGGNSEEKAVSLSGGAAVYKAITESLGWEAVLVDPAMTSWQQIPCDVVFPVLHGADGEDGQLQKVLEKSGRPFVGSRSTACEVTFNKTACSDLLSRLGVNCPGEVTLPSYFDEETWAQEFGALCEAYPDTQRWVVKPNQQGSSIGISVLDQHDPSDEAGNFQTRMNAAIRQALQFDDLCVIQQYIAGREITVSMLDGEALSAIEIQVPTGFYDFHAKYESTETEYRVVCDEAADLCCAIAKEINVHCGTSGIVRIDFRVDLSGQPWFLEVNTIPGMTERSLVPQSAADWGWSLAELCRRAVENALG